MEKKVNWIMNLILEGLTVPLKIDTGSNSTDITLPKDEKKTRDKADIVHWR